MCEKMTEMVVKWPNSQLSQVFYASVYDNLSGALGNDLKKVYILSFLGAAIAVDANNKRQAVTFILKPEIRNKIRVLSTTQAQEAQNQHQINSFRSHLIKVSITVFYNQMHFYEVNLGLKRGTSTDADFGPHKCEL